MTAGVEAGRISLEPLNREYVNQGLFAREVMFGHFHLPSDVSIAR